MALIEDSVRQALRENKIRYQNLKAGAESVKVKIDNINARSKAVSAFRKIDNGLQVEEGQRQRNRNPLYRAGPERTEAEGGRPVNRNRPPPY